MVSLASRGTARRIAARILLRALRAGAGTRARYSATFLGAALPLAVALPAFFFFTPESIAKRSRPLRPDRSIAFGRNLLAGSFERALTTPSLDSTAPFWMLHHASCAFF